MRLDLSDERFFGIENLQNHGLTCDGLFVKPKPHQACVKGLSWLVDGLVRAKRYGREMAYTEAPIGIFGKVAKFPSYLYIDFVGVYLLWKCELESGETLSICCGCLRL